MKIIRPTAITDQGGSFTRSTTATYTDSSGVLQTAAINVPRVDYKYNTTKTVWECKGVLLEQAATNLVKQSQALSTSPWAGTTITSTAVTHKGIPFWKTAKALSTGSEALSQVIGTSATGTFYTVTLALRADTSSSISVGLYGGTNGWPATDMSSEILEGPGTISFAMGATNALINVTGLSSTVTTVVRFTRKYSIAENIILYLYPDLHSSLTIGKSVLATMVQLETSTTSNQATSYIPTTTTTVTRAADVCTGLGYIYSNIAETDYAAWNAGTAYVIGNRVIRTTATTHAIYERVVAGTTGTAPEADAVNWIYVGPTNRWAVFDDSPSTLSSNTDTVTYILKPGKVNSIALLELEGTEVAINMYADGALQFSAYNDLLSNDNVGNWYEYFYEPFYYQTSLAITDLINAALLDMPMYTDTIITVTIRKPAVTTSIGCLVLGIVYELGKTQNGMNVGIIDYSRKDTDTYGNTILVRRKFSRRIRASFFLYSSKVDTVSNLLTQYRATPVVWIAADSLYSSLVVYGFYRDWDIGIPNNIGSTCSIEIEGLT